MQLPRLINFRFSPLQAITFCFSSFGRPYSVLSRIGAILIVPLPVFSPLFLVPKTGFDPALLFFRRITGRSRFCKLFLWLSYLPEWSLSVRFPKPKLVLILTLPPGSLPFPFPSCRGRRSGLVPQNCISGRLSFECTVAGSFFELSSLTPRFQFGFLAGRCFDSSVTRRFATVSLS